MTHDDIVEAAAALLPARIDSEHYAPPAAVVTYVPKDRPAPAAKDAGEL